MTWEDVQNHKEVSFSYETEVNSVDCDFVKNVADKMHIENDFLIDKVMKLYSEFKSSHILDKNGLLMYLFYKTCKDFDYPRSLREISAHSGVSEKRMNRIDKFTRSQDAPIDAYQILTAHYIFLDLSYSQLKDMFQMIDLIENDNYHPITIAATVSYIYLRKHNKKSSMKHIADLFKISPMSIHRCVNYIKRYNPVIM